MKWMFKNIFSTLMLGLLLMNTVVAQADERKNMTITRIYTGSDNQSHFDTHNIQITKGKIGYLSIPQDASHLMFGEVDDTPVVNWHNPPVKQYVVMLKGAMEVEVGSGEKRIFKAGDVLLAEDTTGQGHITRAMSKDPRQYMVIPIS